jgi:hypothetical protein
MVWPGNYNRYAAATLFTLFFAGNTYAPDCRIDGQSAQDYLQEHYIAAWTHCYRRLKNCAAIVGWGIMNEPHQGFITYSDISKPENPVVPLGLIPSPFEAMAAASGHTVSASVYAVGPGGIKPMDHKTLNPYALSLFREGFVCPWKQAGVWTDEGGEPKILKKDYFVKYQDRKAYFANDFLKPFIIRFIGAMREKHPECLFFIEGVPSGEHIPWTKEDPAGIVNAFHHYDGFTLYTKTFIPWFNLRIDNSRPVLGRKKTAAYYAECVSDGVKWADDHMDGAPSLLGEFGLPFDLNKRKAFKTGDYSKHEEALTVYYDALDANLMGGTIWDYTADNTNKTGDNWNEEDLSIFSEGKGRALGGWLRPYPMATAGTPKHISWDRKRGIFGFCYDADGAIDAPTEIFLPAEWFGDTPGIEYRTDGKAAIGTKYDSVSHRLSISSAGYSGELRVIVRTICRKGAQGA